MVAQIQNVFDGFEVTVAIPAQHLTAAQTTAIKQVYGKGNGNGNGKGTVSLQYHCAVAEATNEAFGGVYDERRNKLAERYVLDFGDLGTFVLHNASRARFGIDQSNRIFLTVGLIEENQADDSARYRLTWRGDAIPESLARIAVAHDRGENHQEVVVPLSLGDAQLRAVRKAKPDNRAYTEKRKAEKNGDPPHGRPRKHRRVCDTDIDRIYSGS